MGENCKYECLYDKCEKTEDDVKLCKSIMKDINIATNLTRVDYADIENVRKYVDKILKLEKETGITKTFQIIDDHTGLLICPACNDTIFLKLSDSYICITCYRKHYVEGHGWYDLEHYDIIRDMIEREKARRLLYESGNLDATKKFLKIHKKRNKKNKKTTKKYSNFGEVLLNMDEFTVICMNELLDKLNHEGLLYDTKEDAIEYIIGESKRYNFDLVLEKDENKKDEYDMYITWKGNRILDGFVRIDNDNSNKWWMSFRYFYIGD